MTHTTKEQIEAIHKAYDYFNASLFNNELPQCMLNFSKAGKRAMGFFAPNCWEEANEIEDENKMVHEISLCPQWVNRNAQEVFSTLAHEMVHLWQQENGKPSRNGYHNKEWAHKMISVGLFPSDTGKRGGKITGQSVSHYILPHGMFSEKFEAISEVIRLPFVYAYPDLSTALMGKLKAFGGDEEYIKASVKGRNKLKYSCPACETNVWGKPSLRIICGECHENFVLRG